jgi:cyclopropane fatty-acyl-phospholipid synthase-like methyltransferase
MATTTFLSAKELLLGYDFNTSKDAEGNKSRGTAHEFQDFAYRLAQDLNDLEHLPIYMRLTRNYPRIILEKIYEFVADINEENKGKLFMWKFKQVKQDIQLKKDLENFEYEFVISKMKGLRNSLSNSIFKKYENLDSNFLAKIINQLDFGQLTSKSHVLFIGNNCSLLPAPFLAKKCKVHGVDISRNLTAKLKGIYVKNAKNFITKDYLKTAYSDNQFELIIVNNYWQIIPLEKEEEFIKNVRRNLQFSGRILLITKNSDVTKQSWKQMTVANEVKYYFEKTNAESDLLALFERNKLKVVSEFENREERVYLLSNM